MNDETFDHVMRFLIMNNYSGYISFGSGEPFIYKPFLNRLDFMMKELPTAKFRILTNGTSLVKIPREILENDRVTIGITFDGMKQEDLEGLQTGLKIENVLSDFLSIKPYLKNYYLNYTATKRSEKSLSLFLQFCLDNNVPSSYITELRVWEKYKDVLNEYRPNGEYLRKTYQAFLPEFKKKGLHLDLSLTEEVPIKQCYLNGTNSLIIDVDGSVAFCSGREDSIVGNVRDNDLMAKIEKTGQALIDNSNNNWCDRCSNKIDEEQCFSVNKKIYDLSY